IKMEGLQLISHEKNQGKGAAIQTGLKNATGDAVIIQDADLEYDPNDIKLLILEMQRDPDLAAVYGSRNLKPKRRGYSFFILGVYVLTQLVNILYRSKLTDVYTCYKLIRTPVFKSLGISSSGFEFEMEVTVKMLQRKLAIAEVPISYNPRKFEEGKKIRFLDGLIGLWVLFKNYF
ncbi:glycosyltransferase family 2 protein, partial [bacterium]